jgi:hypothetical protein
MGGIVVHSRVYGEGGRIRVEVDTLRDGVSAWMKDFQDAKDILSLLLRIAPEETKNVRDFVTRTVNFGEGHVELPCKEMDFSKYDFEKLPPA